jgi:hypothetical protein
MLTKINPRPFGIPFGNQRSRGLLVPELGLSMRGHFHPHGERHPVIDDSFFRGRNIMKSRHLTKWLCFFGSRPKASGQPAVPGNGFVFSGPSSADRPLRMGFQTNGIRRAGRAFGIWSRSYSPRSPEARSIHSGSRAQNHRFRAASQGTVPSRKDNPRGTVFPAFSIALPF